MLFSLRRITGFSLVELSIVLVILGLLVGGVLSGQSLIHAAELRSIPTQYSTYYAAVNGFRDKYFALPGDMPNATQIWGTSTGCPTTPATDSKTCDGNGDGQINQNLPTLPEYTRAWQHLANAGLITGSYDGVSAYTTGTPTGKISSSRWQLYYLGTVWGMIAMFDGDYANSFILSGFTGTRTTIPFLNSADVWNIDKKVDDGMPATGKVVVYMWGLNNCTDTADPSMLNANYLLNTATINCAMVFRNQF